METPVSLTQADIAEGASVGQALLGLNNAHAVALSWLSAAQFRYLVAQSFLAMRVGDSDALLLAFDQDAAYDSPNFLWFRSRFARFVYVDRVVVAAGARGRGYARRLYAELFAEARGAGHRQVVCEVNADPPNPGSDAFHAALGFRVVGSAHLADRGKTVSYLIRPLA